MRWGLAVAIVMAALAPVASWWVAKPRLARRLVLACAFGDDPVAVWRRANIRVPLTFMFASLATGALSFAFVGIGDSDKGGLGDTLAMTAGSIALFIGLPGWRIMSVLAKGNLKPRYVGSAPTPALTPPRIIITGGPSWFARTTLWFVALVAFFFALGVGATLPSPWGAVVVLFPLFVGLTAARISVQRAHVMTDRVMISTMFFEKVWHVSKLDAVHLGDTVTMRDKSGQVTKARRVHFAKKPVDLSVCALPLVNEPPTHRWGSEDQHHAVRRPLRLGTGETIILVLCGLEALLIIAAPGLS